MSVIIDFITSFLDAIHAAFSYLISTIGDFLYMLRSMLTVRNSIGSLFSWLPLECVGVLVIIFSLAVVLRIIGR